MTDDRNEESKHRYSNALRCIGQSIEPLALKAVELKVHGEAYVVQGWRKGTTGALDLDKQYTPEDINQLELAGRNKRAAESDPPNLLSLSEVLRLAGIYVDRMRGRLLRVSWQDQSDKIQSVTIQFEDGGHERSGDSQIATVEELCIHIYKQRKRIATGSDKSQRVATNVGVGN